MEHFPEFENDVEFTERLISEQSVFCLPATVSLMLKAPGSCGAKAWGRKQQGFAALSSGDRLGVVCAVSMVCNGVHVLAVSSEHCV